MSFGTLSLIFILTTMRVLTIGRHPENDVVIRDNTVGRYHAQIIQHDDGHFSLLDMNSINGTFINGKRVNGEVRLNPSDIVQIGKNILPWKTYFTNSPKHNKNKAVLYTTLGITAGVVATILFVVLLFCGESFHVRTDTDANTQVTVTFSDNVSDLYARFILKIQGAQILASRKTYNYYFVSTRSESSAKQLVTYLNKRDNVDFASQNQYVSPCGIKMTAIDDDKTLRNGESMTHGKMVTDMMTIGGNFTADMYDVKTIGKSVTRDDLAKGIMDICDKMSDDDLNIINLSWGVSDSIYDKKLQRNVPKEKSQYFKESADEIIDYATLAHKCGKKNFIITKAMGNEGIHDIDIAFQMALSHEKMDSIKLKALSEHVIIVAAKDTRREYRKDYSNRMREGIKIPSINTIMVDISNFSIDYAGTSAAAPLVANWIAKSGFEKASDAINAINESTKNGELVSENLFKTVAKKYIHEKNSPKMINNTSNSKPKSSQVSEITIEGVVKMYILDSSGNSKIKTSTYDLDETDAYVVFVLEADRTIDVSPYLEASDKELLDDMRQSVFMIVLDNNSSKRKLASQYAYKKVRVTGSLCVPGAGWQNATEVVMTLNSIELYQNENFIQKSVPKKEHSPLNTTLSIPANLIGTKWVYENGYSAEGRTIIFLSSDEAKIIDEDINIWTERHPPVSNVYGCYYDNSSNRLIIKRKSDMVIIGRVWMQFRLENGMMIEDTNPNVEIVYKLVN